MVQSGAARFRDPRLDVDARVADLLQRLTPEEKAGQLTSVALPADGRLDVQSLRPPPGLVTAAPGHWRDTAARVRVLQDQLAAADGWGIPALVVTLRTYSGAVRFPGAIARAATWDQGLVEDIGAASAAETRAGGATAQLGPVLALACGPAPVAPADRDLSYGDDPVLAAELVAAHVRGAQGTVAGRVRRDGCAVVVTHLGGTASQLSGSPARDPHERLMRSALLVPAEAAVQAGALLAVPTRAANAGVPGHADSWLLRDVLRREWGFEGAVLAAAGALDGLVDEHRVVADLDAAHALALEAGVDVVGAAGSAERLVGLLRTGALPSWLVDDAVAAVLRVKMALGLFEDHAPLDEVGLVAGPGHRELGHRATVESLVLLGDSGGVLPLAGVSAVDVLCTDDAAGPLPDTRLLVQALSVSMPECVVRDLGDGAADAPDLAGTVVAVVRGDVRRAATVVSRIVATGRRCVTLVCTGDVDAAPALASTTAAVLLCWQPLAHQADAVAEVLAGAVEPGGRLPFGLQDSARYPLGHGHGYTTFEYSHLQIVPSRTAGAEPVVVQFRLTNTGRRAGKEVAQIYLHDHVSSVRRPRRQLVDFATVRLEAGRSRQVRLRLPPARLAVWDRTMRRVVEPGEFDVLVGRSATDIRLVGTFSAGTGGEAAIPHPRRTSEPRRVSAPRRV